MTDAVSSAMASRRPKPVRNKGWRNALFVLPYMVVFVFMIVLPLGLGFSLSLTRADLFGVERFVGLDHYAALLADPFFRRAVFNTFYFVALTVPALAIIGLLLAMALNRQTRWAAICRGVFFSSTVLSVTVVTLVWRLVFIPDGGLLALINETFGAAPVNWLNSPYLAMPAIAITTIWWCIGLPMALYLAALQQVPRELYEAAALDGAGRWRTFRNITLPAVQRTTIVVVIIEVILQFQLFGQAQLMTQGGPNNATRPLVLFIYESGWRQWQLGYASAAAQILFALIVLVAMAQYGLTNRKGDA